MAIKLPRVMIFYIFITNINSQPDSRFRPFDWIVYRGSGSISSITEGYNYAFIGTSQGGVKRFNLFGNYFDSPLTRAQGLKDNNISAIHFDKQTGFLWISTPQHIQYSFSREGGWYSKSLSSIGLSKFDSIYRIGSTENFIWLEARSSYVKLDNSSATMIGIFPRPDELDINWSSGLYKGETILKTVLLDYHVLDGWIYNGDEMIDPYGRRSIVSTGFSGAHGNIYFGSRDGKIFLGSKTMQTLSPIRSDIENIDVSALIINEGNMWIGSNDYIHSKGISKLNFDNMSSTFFSYEETINMTPTSVFCLNYYDNELWAGGESNILYYNDKDNFWRTLGENKGVPDGRVLDIEIDETNLWIGTSKGIGRMERSTLSPDPIGIEKIFNDISIYDIEKIDDQIWIGTSRGIYIFFKNNPQILDINSIGRKTFPDNLYNATVIKEHDNIIYIVSDIGIVTFDFDSKEWILLFTSGIYQNKTVYSMIVNDKFIFLGLDDGLMKINKNTGLVKEYFFSFIGKVNDIALDKKAIWLGTSNGLINFKWRRDF